MGPTVFINFSNKYFINLLLKSTKSQIFIKTKHGLNRLINCVKFSRYQALVEIETKRTPFLLPKTELTFKLSKTHAITRWLLINHITKILCKPQMLFFQLKEQKKKKKKCNLQAIPHE